MKLTVQEARERFKEALEAVAENGHVLITKHGRPVAGIVCPHEMAMLEVLTQEEWAALKLRAESAPMQEGVVMPEIPISEYTCSAQVGKGEQCKNQAVRFVGRMARCEEH